ncbi:MAG: hypothetical protein JWO78_1890 [Micavibrio sp.]|nr:hypothetical protein [Micavibrio sp.]
MLNDQRSATGSCGSYVEWSAILAGAVLALAISTVLMQFGAAIGLALHSPYRTEELTSGGALAIGGWMLWVQVSSSFAGGYLAGRLRAPVAYSSEHERETRDGMHGALAWATATIAVVIAAAVAAAFAALTAHDPEVAKVTPDVERIRHNTAIIFAFVTASISLVSGVGAWWAATKGGEHRDDPLAHKHYVTFRR